jgi:hypothetical protein
MSMEHMDRWYWWWHEWHVYFNTHYKHIYYWKTWFKNNFTIQSHNKLDFENDDFTISLNYTMMNEFEYRIFLDNEIERKFVLMNSCI